MKYSHDSGILDNFSLETIDTAQRDRVGSSYAIELRRCPRVDTWFKAHMTSDYGRIDGFVSNLSRSGLCFEAGSELPDLFMTGNGQHASQASSIVEISFDLPIQNAGCRPLIVQARTVYVIQGDEGRYRCGAEFRFLTEGEEALENYLRDRGAGK